MTLLGAKAYAEVFSSWLSVVPMSGRLDSTGADFIEQALDVVTVHRRQVEAITVTFMRLFRALHTGYTWQNVMTGEVQTAVPLSILRQDFLDSINLYAPGALESDEIPDPDPTDDVTDVEVRSPDGSEFSPYSLEEWLDDLDIEVEDLDWLEDELNKIEDELNAEAEALLELLGPIRLKQRLEELSADDKLQTAQEVEAERESEHLAVGRAVAAHGERIVLNGGRMAEYRVGKRDQRVTGFVRVHEPKGNPPDAYPCGFCALLMTRGFVTSGGSLKMTYRSEKAAGGTANEDGENPDQFHVRDHCRVEQVFSVEQINDDTRFNLNRELAELYRANIQGRYGGDQALTKWRRLIRDINADRASA